MIRIELEPKNLHSGFAENCCFCGKETRYWHPKKDVPLCPNCALIHKEKEVPTKTTWIKQMESKRIAG
jgi:hypothetical protein